MRESLRAGGDSGFVLKERVVRVGVGRGRAWVVVCVGCGAVALERVRSLASGLRRSILWSGGV